MIKSQRAKTAQEAANWLVMNVRTNPDIARAAVWVGRFDVLSQYAGYLSSAQIDAYIAQASALLPGFAARYEELSK